MDTLEYVWVYLDDLLTITKDTLEDHLSKLRKVLIKLRDKNLKVKAEKSFFFIKELEYLGYVLMCNGIKPMPMKVSAILVIEPPTSVKKICSFLCMVQY